MARIHVLLAHVILLLGQGTIAAEVGNSGTFQFSSPTRLATASCTDFPWISDLPLCLETANLLKRVSVDVFHLTADDIDSWENGSSEEFLTWLGQVADKGRPDSTLVFYFVTHQLKDGQEKFNRGTGLSGGRLIEAINRVAIRYHRVLFINDCCYGAALEKQGNFSSNVIRLYTADEEHAAYNLDFEKGPYGLAKFLAKERAYLKADMKWEPRGMTFFGLIALKTGLDIAEKPESSIDLRMIFERMIYFCNLYDDKVRQHDVQKFILMPTAANFEILNKKSNSLQSGKK
jgi:hypothetical protein